MSDLIHSLLSNLSIKLHSNKDLPVFVNVWDNCYRENEIIFVYRLKGSNHSKEKQKITTAIKEVISFFGLGTGQPIYYHALNLYLIEGINEVEYSVHCPYTFEDIEKANNLDIMVNYFKLNVQKVKGNIFDYEDKSNILCLCNATNAQGVMGAGIAFAFAERYPEMLKEYELYCESKLHGIGVPHLHIPKDVSKPNIANVCTMTFPGQRTIESELKASLAGLFNLFLSMEDNKERWSIVMPYLGCGIGGFDKKRFEEILENWQFYIEPPFDIILVDY